MSGFVINLGTLPAGRGRIRAVAEPSQLDLPAAVWPGEVRGDLGIDRTGELLSVRGTVQATARLECVRCLEEFDLPLEAELAVVADRAGGPRRLEEDLEAGSYMKFHDGRQLDLGEETREALLLELPITPHCREDCRGLCPRCGANRNQGPCRCERARAGAGPAE
ncbi:MAG: DUF177 domain-containing protein [Candidatus Eisenbacteria bacterium]|uniref:DUF177 domain-containing protein n=1 Tax=Eiseniibacteriota bacterium TaxID=2212470 RepID=A0A9D6QI38_UNCEI|nr:DUF177 domain-containing protein [Candidatus Eisenbacteria bacterium]MBI3538852.1 DUF177 domain-containing protein [Candidatus Eisenbacteria bacterium]